MNDGYIHWKPKDVLNGFNSVIEYPFDRWVHVKLLVKNDKAELYLDNKPEPVAVVNKLLQEQKAGAVGVYSNISTMRFANFSYTQTDDVVLKKIGSRFKYHSGKLDYAMAGFKFF